jgi:hypothetical protein
LDFGAGNIENKGLEEAISLIEKDIIAGRISDISAVNELLVDVQNGTGIPNNCEIQLGGDLDPIPFGRVSQVYKNLFFSGILKYNDGQDGMLRGLLFAYKAIIADQNVNI